MAGAPESPQPSANRTPTARLVEIDIVVSSFLAVPGLKTGQRYGPVRALTITCSRRFVVLAVLLAAAPASALDPATRLTQYGRDAWQVEDGLPQNTIKAIHQTRDGYLWLATEEGLARFDGVRFTVFDSTNTPEMTVAAVEGMAE